MVTSMHVRVPAVRRSHYGRRHMRIAVSSATCLVAVGLGAPAQAAPLLMYSNARVPCTTPQAPASIIGAVPWAQARYDLASLGQISDGAGTTIAVIDSGVDATNPQLANAVRPGGDLLDSTGNGTDDCVGHGTAVASVIAARPLPGVGLRGIAPAATILAIRVSERTENESGTATGAGDVQALIDGIRRAVAARPKPH